MTSSALGAATMSLRHPSLATSRRGSCAIHNQHMVHAVSIRAERYRPELMCLSMSFDVVQVLQVVGAVP